MRLLALGFLLSPFLFPAEIQIRYRTESLRGWTVHLEQELHSRKELRQEVLGLLAAKLRELDSRLPRDVVERLREVEIYFHLDRKGNPGAAYHPSTEWLREHDLNPDWAGNIEFGNAANFLTWIHDQPSMVLHEMAHAWHHQVLGYDHGEILGAFQAASDSGEYQEVLYVRGGRHPSYALNNEQEYFAESSEAWWGTNDNYPFVRGELLEHDPRMAEVLERVWSRVPATK